MTMADAAQPRSTRVVKSLIIGADLEQSDELVALAKADAQSDDDPASEGILGSTKAEYIDPPYPIGVLVKLVEQSSSLRPNIDAYKTNIDGFGHVFAPVIELNGSGAREAVADAISIDRYENAPQSPLQALMPPTDTEIDQRIKQLRDNMRWEKARVESFFSNCVVEESFTALRTKTREDLEATGNSYWEIIRNDSGIVSQFAYMPSRSMRLGKKKSRMLSVRQPVRIGAFTFRDEIYRRKFRRYLQLGGDSAVYFKEFGDPTILSAKTGKEYDSFQLMQVDEGTDCVAANEVLHFKIHSPRVGGYGVPRWIGNMLSVLGSRSAEEVNLAYFENKAIPPIALLVSGGELGPDSVARIENYVEQQLKGKKNFHKILIIEAAQLKDDIGLSDNKTPIHLEIKLLTDAQLKDGLFQAYDAANIDKVGMGFRIPRLLRGDIRDFNRATALAALVFAESQVFLPLRNEFDFAMNHLFLPALGIRLWTFKSNGPQLSDAEDWGDMIVKLTNAGVLTPADSRELAGKLVLAKELPVLKADWTNQPLSLTIAGVQADTQLDGLVPNNDNMAGIQPAADPARLTQATEPNSVFPNATLLNAAKRKLMAKAKELMKLRDIMNSIAESEVVKEYKQDRIDNGELVFDMTRAEIQKTFGIVPK